VSNPKQKPVVGKSSEEVIQLKKQFSRQIFDISSKITGCGVGLRDGSTSAEVVLRLYMNDQPTIPELQSIDALSQQMGVPIILVIGSGAVALGEMPRSHALLMVLIAFLIIVISSMLLFIVSFLVSPAAGVVIFAISLIGQIYLISPSFRKEMRTVFSRS
jgi:hypothetical protein